MAGAHTRPVHGAGNARHLALYWTELPDVPDEEKDGRINANRDRKAGRGFPARGGCGRGRGGPLMDGVVGRIEGESPSIASLAQRGWCVCSTTPATRFRRGS